MRTSIEHDGQTEGQTPLVSGVLQHRRARRIKAGGSRRGSEDNDGRSARGERPNANVSRRRTGGTSSSIAALVTNPSTASDIPMRQIPALVAELASEQATLSALQGVLTARLLASQDNAETTEFADRLLTAEQVATILGVTKRWVERRARRLPFARRLSAHAVRYSESGLRRWMSNRQMRIA